MEKSSHRPHQDEYHERVNRRGERMAETQSKLTQVLKRIDDLDTLEAAIRDEMLVP